MDFIMKTLIVTAVCWLPLHILKMLLQRIDPSEEAKVKKT